MDRIKWIIFTVVVVGIFAGIILVNKNNQAPAFNGDAYKIIDQGPIADHVLGGTNQKVTLIEYGDYECPGCGRMYQTVKDLNAKYQNNLTIIFREFPLTSIHPNALAAATAAEAAGMQGKYYDMHDLIYQNQDSWAQASVADRTGIFQNYAQQIDLNVDKFKQDLSSKDITDKINRDISTGKNTFSVDSTPTFILNGKKVDSGVGVDSAALTKLVEDAMTAAYPAK